MATKKISAKKTSQQDYSQMTDEQLLNEYWNGLSFLDKAKFYGSAIGPALPSIALDMANPMGSAGEKLAQTTDPAINQMLASGMSRGAVPAMPNKYNSQFAGGGGNPLQFTPKQQMALDVFSGGTNALAHTAPSEWYGGDVLFKALQHAGDKTKQGITKADLLWQAIAYAPFGKIGKEIKGGGRKIADLIKLLKP